MTSTTVPIVPDLKRTDVVEQSKNTSLWNTQPVVLKGAIVSAVGAVCAILAVFGWISPEQTAAITTQAGVILTAILVILPIVAAVWGRASAWSPQAAATTAVVNVDAAYEAGKADEPKPVPVLAITK